MTFKTKFELFEWLVMLVILYEYFHAIDEPCLVDAYEKMQKKEDKSNGGRRRSSWFSMRERHEGDVRMEKNRKEERRERHDRRGGEPRKEELDMSNSFDLHGCKVVRLVTLEFCGDALVWGTQVLEEIRSVKKDLVRVEET
ncbi:hypothetical protein CR513_03219, partial [Mucuna pruriens]